VTRAFEGQRIVPVWTEAARRLNETPGRTARNYILDIKAPSALLPEDLSVIHAADASAQASGGLSTDTVAGTLFPNGLYRRFGRPDFYKRYVSAIQKGKDVGTWGTYDVTPVLSSATD
jgi:hypothetical protein